MLFYREKFNTDKKLYLKMIYQKTASLIEASAEASAILAGKKREIYRVYGKNLGLAFQMIDDLLDITQSSQILGKPGKCTIQRGKSYTSIISILYGTRFNEDRIEA